MVVLGDMYCYCLGSVGYVRKAWIPEDIAQKLQRFLHMYENDSEWQVAFHGSYQMLTECAIYGYPISLKSNLKWK